MKFATKNALAVLALAVISTGVAFAQSTVDHNDLVAQQAGQRGQGGIGQGGQRGPGGPGGPGGPMMGQRGGGPLGILMDPKVRDHLKITDAQVQELMEALRPAGGPGRGGQGGQRGQGGVGQGGQRGQRGQGGPGGPGGPGMDPERQKEIDAKLKSVLNDAQYKRFKELSLQREGASALARPDVAQQVGLSDQQNQQIRQILESNRPQRGQGGQRGQRGQGQGIQGQPPTREEMQAQQALVDQKIIAVLNANQKSKWQSMQGAKFTFSEPTQGSPGGRRGGGGGGTEA